MSSPSSSLPGELWLVATPLGNPGDITARAREALERAEWVLAEDTRRTGLLLAALGLKAKRLVSFHDHNEEERLDSVLEELRQGRNIALVSDAGTPLVSDPGYRLVRACRAEGLNVRPLPGPSAVLAALSASGLPPIPFVFLGFSPRKKGEQKSFFGPYQSLPLTLVFFERKDRVRPTLEHLLELLGPREGCLCREMTKTYEEFVNFRLDDLSALPEEILGEVTIVIGPPEAGAGKLDAAGVIALARELDPEGALKPKELARRVKELAPGWSSSEIYSLLTR